MLTYRTRVRWAVQWWSTAVVTFSLYFQHRDWDRSALTHYSIGQTGGKNLESRSGRSRRRSKPREYLTSRWKRKRIHTRLSDTRAYGITLTTARERPSLHITEFHGYGPPVPDQGTHAITPTGNSAIVRMIFLVPRSVWTFSW